MPDAAGIRHWISFEDPDEHRTWLFDVTFLDSAWTCIYGAGCPGTDAEPAPELARGCCDHGAYLSDEDDRAHVEAMIAELDEETWGRREEADAVGGPLWRDEEGWWRTRVVDGVCVFQNTPSHPAGPGCAFHQLALATGRRPMDVKPEICWQAPIRREDHETVTGHVYSMVREWERRDWGGEDTEVSWWCTSAPEAHVGHQPVYVGLRSEIEAICGTTVYRWLRDALDDRTGESGAVPVRITER